MAGGKPGHKEDEGHNGGHLQTPPALGIRNRSPAPPRVGGHGTHTGLPLTGHALPSASLYSATAASYSADISSQRSSCWVSWAASWARSLASWVAVVGSFS